MTTRLKLWEIEIPVGNPNSKNRILCHCENLLVLRRDIGLIKYEPQSRGDLDSDIQVPTKLYPQRPSYFGIEIPSDL